ncbi:MAG: hypothetical protein P4L36_18530 [Holophaga sp.]|nr:hypothetical protein [Holophaga sp.]
MMKAFATGVLLFGIAALPVKATEFGLLLDKEIGRAEALSAAGAAGSGLPMGGYDRSSPSGLGFRAAYTFLNLRAAELGAAVTYHPKIQDDLTVGGTNVGKFGSEYMAIGVQADWKFLLNLHAGLDMRSEKLTTSPSGGGSDSTTLIRPWVKAGVGYTLPTPVVSPFVRLELAVPLTNSDSSSSAEDFRKAMAPSLQVALYGGIRF